jgi:hypothetical protein
MPELAVVAVSSGLRSAGALRSRVARATALRVREQPHAIPELADGVVDRGDHPDVRIGGRLDRRAGCEDDHRFVAQRRVLADLFDLGERRAAGDNDDVAVRFLGIRGCRDAPHGDVERDGQLGDQPEVRIVRDDQDMLRVTRGIATTPAEDRECVVDTGTLLFPPTRPLPWHTAPPSTAPPPTYPVDANPPH